MTTRRRRLPGRAGRPHLRGRPGGDRHRRVPDPAEARARRTPGPRDRPAPQQRVPRPARCPGRAGARRGRRQHGLPDRPGARAHARGAPVDQHAADAARRRHGITLRGRTVGVSGPEVQFADGGRLAPGAVIWATGFSLDHSWVRLPVFDAGGRLVHRRGVTSSPGLFFLGLAWQHTRGSALLGWVKDDAEHVAAQIAARAATTRSAG